VIERPSRTPHLTPRTLVLTLGYTGTRFAGFAVQHPRTTHGRPTVQATLESALRDIVGHPVRVTAAGRTDAGVHADGQVVSFDTASSIPAAGLARALNALLPEDVWCVEARTAHPGFSARRSARRRWYRYAIWNARSVPPAAWHGRCLVEPKHLDLAAMRSTSRCLVGRLDAASFGTQHPRGKSTRRTVLAADWLHTPGQPLILFEVCADAFVRGMVRSLVGSLLWVGRGRWTADDFLGALGAADRRAGGPSAPAHGLTLHRVDY
jgi:tRNA pseudouridine38-40 synthase